MSPQFFSLLLAFLIFLLIYSICMSLYLVHDIISGNYRELLGGRASQADQHRPG